MQVVDAVEVHVLGVPGEARLPHAEVQVGGVHALDGDAAVFLDHVQDGVQVPDVPLLDVLTSHTHTHTVFFPQVPTLNLHNSHIALNIWEIRFNATDLIVQRPAHVRAVYGWHERHVLPVLSLEVFVVQVARCAVPAHARQSKDQKPTS